MYVVWSYGLLLKESHCVLVNCHGWQLLGSCMLIFEATVCFQHVAIDLLSIFELIETGKLVSMKSWVTLCLSVLTGAKIYLCLYTVYHIIVTGK